MHSWSEAVGFQLLPSRQLTSSVKCYVVVQFSRGQTAQVAPQSQGTQLFQLPSEAQTSQIISDFFQLHQALGRRTKYDIMSASVLLLIAIMIASHAGAQAQYDNIKDVIVRAAGDYAASLHTSLATGALAQGICLQRSDQTASKDTCVNQPSGV